VQLSDFEVNADYRWVLSCLKVHAPLECKSLEQSYALEVKMVA
jgi:hypothetical protein